MCRVHHRELRRISNERSWWDQLNIDPPPIALRFWQHTKGVPSGPNPKAGAQIADVSIAKELEVGGSSDSDLPPQSSTTDHRGTTP
jgi:hypothetical protein